MKKDAYYFSHDANAQDDPKLMLLIEQMGMEGIGIYWCLIEKLRAEKDYKLPLTVLKPFSNRWHTSVEKVETVVKNYDLFKIVKDFFFSVRLKNSMLQKTEAARLSASARWGNANAMRPHSERNANGMRIDAIKVKESKGKKSKGGDLPFGKKTAEYWTDDTGTIRTDNPGEFTPPGPGMVY
jgi:hypothetical protein